MLIGIPKEIASGENRIACSPEIVKKLVKDGHKVFVESGAGYPLVSPTMIFHPRGQLFSQLPRRSLRGLS